jgi:hypothetical protein
MSHSQAHDDLPDAPPEPRSTVRFVFLPPKVLAPQLNPLPKGGAGR